jgi:MoxR-like ATPase
LHGLIRLGVSPRGGTINVRKACRAQAFLRGRTYVLPDDVKAIVPDIFRHRLLLDFRAEGTGLGAEDIINRILDKVEIP